MANWRVIGKVYTGGQFYGTIIGWQGDDVLVEREVDGEFYTFKWSLSAMRDAGDKVEWCNVKPVGVMYA